MHMYSTAVWYIFLDLSAHKLHLDTMHSEGCLLVKNRPARIQRLWHLTVLLTSDLFLCFVNHTHTLDMHGIKTPEND